MKVLIAILIIASFLQTTILPINLVLLILICRAYVRSDKSNLLLAFGFGLLIAHLNLTNLGIQSLIYIIIIQITDGLSRSRLAGNLLLIIPISFVLLSCNQIINFYIFHQGLDFSKIMLEAILSLPVLYLVKLWEERFVVRKEIRLKM